MFSDSSHINASGSNLSNVGRDQYSLGRGGYAAAGNQYIVHGNQYIQPTIVNIPPTAPPEAYRNMWDSHHHNFPQQPLPPFTVVTESHYDHSTCDVASNLITEIQQLLDDLRKFSVDYRYLQQLLLQPLHQTLFLTGLAVQAYENTPLGPNLSAGTNREVDKCSVILRDILDGINNYRQFLYSKTTPLLPSQVLWRGSEVHKLTWKLSARQNTLGEFLVALNS
jgi:hypothetical protein